MRLRWLRASPRVTSVACCSVCREIDTECLRLIISPASEAVVCGSFGAQGPSRFAACRSTGLAEVSGAVVVPSCSAGCSRGAAPHLLGFARQRRRTEAWCYRALVCWGIVLSGRSRGARQEVVGPLWHRWALEPAAARVSPEILGCRDDEPLFAFGALRRHHVQELSFSGQAGRV